jgi:hypothetical protein
MPSAVSGKHMLYNVSAVVNGVDLSNRLEAIELPVSTRELMAAAMGEVQDYNFPGTLSVGDLKLTFYQDYAAAKVYNTFYAAWANRTIFNVLAKADAGANAVDNPQFTIPVFVKDMPLMGGTRGDRHMAPVTLSIAGVIAVATS